MRILKVLSIVLFVAICFVSCKNEKEFVPELPPRASFITDFSDFDNNKSISETTKLNWGHAAGNVFVWNAIITVGLAVPIASYAEAVANHEPIYQGDDTWLWEYSFPNAKNIYSAKLFGTVSDNSIYWEMFISKDGEYDDFMWYTGTSLLDGSKVNWTLYNKPGDESELLSIEYNKVSEDIGNITYTNIVPNGAENGGYIKYGNDSDNDFDSYYQIYNKGLDNLISIEWAHLQKDGRVKDEIKFQDTEWHCWNENQEDIECD